MTVTSIRGGSPRGRVARKVIVGLAMTSLAGAIFALILLSPLLLRQIGTLKGANWGLLSEIGQTYGAASAILSAVALGGVAVSLFLQAEQARANHIQMVREYQKDLLGMALESPEVYLPCLRPIDLDLDLNGQRQHYFISLRLNYARMSYEVGIMSEGSLRGNLLQGLFHGVAGREYWECERKNWALNKRRAARRFFHIVENEYRKAVAAGPPSIGRTADYAPGRLCPRLTLVS